MTRAATVEPSSFDAETRRFEVVWSTGARVARNPFFAEPYDEELSLREGEVDLARLNAGAPVLDNHNRFGGANTVMGVVERAWLVDGKEEGRATVRLAQTERVDELAELVEQGILRGISIGYSVNKFQELPREDGERRVLRAVDWQPFEISLVPVGADQDAGVREQEDAHPCTFHLLEADPAASEPIRAMDEDQIQDPAPETPAAAPVAVANPESQRSAPAPESSEQVRAEATRAERARVSEIQALVARAGFDASEAQGYIKDGTEVEAVRAELFEKLATRSTSNVETIPSAPVEVGEEAGDKRMRGLADYMNHRAAMSVGDAYQEGGSSVRELSEGAREFRGMRLLDVCREVLDIHGVRHRGASPMEVAGLALQARGLHGSTSFPLLLSNLVGRRLRAAYEDAPRTFQPWTQRSETADFKDVHRLQTGDFPELLKQGESGEIKFGTMGEGSETYRLATYSRGFGLTRQAIINDDMDAFGRIPRSAGAAAAVLESDLVYGELTGAVKMGDGQTIFHASHNNTGTGVLDVAGMSEGRKLMRKQKSIDKRLMNLQARYLLVPSDLETVAQQQTAAISPNASGQVNPFASQFAGVIVEPRLDAVSALQWYMIADPMMIDTIETLYLEGESGPVVESYDTAQSSNIDGMKWTVRHDFAAKALDFRGLYRSSGA